LVEILMSSLLLVDGAGFMWRAFHAVPMRRRADGVAVNAVEGLISTVLRPIIERNNDTHAAIVFDKPGRTFRHDIHPEYKANRPPTPEDLTAQKAFMAQACKAFGLPCLEVDGCEADDVIATLTRMGCDAGMKVTITSSDKDLMQLLRPGVILYNHQTKAMVREAQVADKFGVPPRQVLDVQALMGDSIDNIPGVPGIGIKSAIKLITRYGSLDGVLAAAETIEEKAWRMKITTHADSARLS
jgi:DNA polymerase-1